MILQELFNVSEARREPGRSDRSYGHAAALKFLQDKDIPEYAVSMTHINKLGVILVASITPQLVYTFILPNIM